MQLVEFFIWRKINLKKNKTTETKLINVTFKDSEKGVNILASSFHKMYEVYTLKCCLSKNDSNELMKELKEAEVRILTN